jgi:hypothetical protein
MLLFIGGMHRFRRHPSFSILRDAIQVRGDAARAV